MIHILPPKRWEDGDNPIYDSIRHKRWYGRGLKRKHHIPMLKLAAMAYNSGGTMEAACAEYGVDPREFRDWYGYNTRKPAFEPLGPKKQVVINAAYRIYCENNADKSFRHCIEQAATYYGWHKRPLVEAWEVNPDVYPTGYKPNTYAK